MQHRDPQTLSEADIAACRAIIREGSKSFHAASILLPKKVRASAMALYSFCRLSDDMVDEGEDRHAAITDLRCRLDLAYAGRPANHVADRGFAAVVHQYDIPRAVPEALIEGYEWDIAGRIYEDIDDLIAYATRVAATVGVMMTIIMGRREPHVLARASDLGVAMQLTNIARDVGEDARQGRIYLPRAWLRDAGVDVDVLIENPAFTPALGSVVKRLLGEADVLYHRGFTGLRDLPVNCRSAIRAAGLVYREIGREVARNGYDSVTQRAVTTRRCKLRLCLRALMEPTWLAICDMRPPLPETQFLVDATAEASERMTPVLGTLDRRMGQLALLLGSLEERDRVPYGKRVRPGEM
ncbi:MAG: phytoene/squalene synthase family protein [Pseudomonadota bacterium]